MDSEILVTEQVEAAADFLQEFEKYYPVEAAFWLRRNAEERPYLYLASKELTPQTFMEGYGKVLEAAAKLGNPNFDPYHVKIIWMDDPMTRAALAIHGRFHARIPAHYKDRMFGDTFVDEVYLYPATDRVNQPV